MRGKFLNLTSWDFAEGVYYLRWNHKRFSYITIQLYDLKPIEQFTSMLLERKGKVETGKYVFMGYSAMETDFHGAFYYRGNYNLDLFQFEGYVTVDGTRTPGYFHILMRRKKHIIDLNNLVKMTLMERELG